MNDLFWLFKIPSSKKVNAVKNCLVISCFMQQAPPIKKFETKFCSTSSFLTKRVG